MNQSVDDTIGGSPWRLARSIRVGEARDRESLSVRAAIYTQVLLRRELVHAVHAERLRLTILGDAAVAARAVREPRADEQDLGVRTDRPHRVEQHEIAAAVHVEVGPGIFDAGDCAR